MVIQPYTTNLLDPRWQLKKADIILRDKVCQLCHDDSAPLHVHHRVYIKSAQPWEYPNEKLITLCENCHIAITSLTKNNFPGDIAYLISEAMEAHAFCRTAWRRNYYQMLLDKYRLAQEYINNYFLVG